MFISNKMFTANKNIAIIFWPNNSRFAKILIQFFVLYINVAISTILSVYLSIHLSIYSCFASFYLSTYLLFDHFLSKDKLAAFFAYRKQVQPVLIPHPVSKSSPDTEQFAGQRWRWWGTRGPPASRARIHPPRWGPASCVPNPFSATMIYFLWLFACLCFVSIFFFFTKKETNKILRRSVTCYLCHVVPMMVTIMYLFCI